METIQSPSMIYEVASSVVRTVQTKFFRDGIEMEKGAVITKKRIEENDFYFFTLWLHFKLVEYMQNCICTYQHFARFFKKLY